MNKDTRLTYLVGIFGFMQLAMMDVKLIAPNGAAPTKRRKLKLHEQDVLAIYDWLGEQLRRFSTEELRPRASVMDGRVKKLLNDHTVVNNLLLGLLLLRDYIDNDADMIEQILLGNKINRLIDVVDGTISDEEFSADIKRTTARTANNLYRQFVGRPQLSDEVRDAHFKRIKR